MLDPDPHTDAKHERNLWYVKPGYLDEKLSWPGVRVEVCVARPPEESEDKD